MTRKDFEVIARIVREQKLARVEKEPLAQRLADHCETRNPNFDRARFVAACLD